MSAVLALRAAARPARSQGGPVAKQGRIGAAMPRRRLSAAASAPLSPRRAGADAGGLEEPAPSSSEQLPESHSGFKSEHEAAQPSSSELLPREPPARLQGKAAAKEKAHIAPSAALALPRSRWPWLDKQKAEKAADLEPLRVRLPTGCRLTVTLGDITRFSGDAIVNAANELMLGGGGVDGAIHHAAGPALLAFCRHVPQVAPGVRCPAGQARLTPSGGRLGVSHVIHAVGPVYSSRTASAPPLAATFAYALTLARLKNLRRVAFPAVSCGIYGFPHREAAEVATRVLSVYTRELDEVTIVLAERANLPAWREAARRVAVAEG